MSQALKVLNEGATFDCVFPVCGGTCCQNGRPGVELAEVAKIEAELAKFLPELTPAAKTHVERSGFITRRQKEGRPTLGVVGGYCLFYNEGCVLHKVGAREGDKFKYKPWRCVVFPLSKNEENGEWHVRQWGVKGEAWDVFCINPEESKKAAVVSLADELVFSAEIEAGRERWRFLKPTKRTARKPAGKPKKR
jgi:hypothetical protein